MTEAGGECEGTLPSSARSAAGAASGAAREGKGRGPAAALRAFCAVCRFCKTVLPPSTEGFAFDSLLLTRENQIQNKSVSTWRYFG